MVLTSCVRSTKIATETPSWNSESWAGTFGYKKEVMHADLVCSEADGGRKIKAYPRVATPGIRLHDQSFPSVIKKSSDKLVNNH